MLKLKSYAMSCKSSVRVRALYLEGQGTSEVVYVGASGDSKLVITQPRLFRCYQ